MIKRFIVNIFFFVVFVSCSKVSAQGDNATSKKLFLCLNAGIGVPVGAFSTVSSNPEFATPGPEINGKLGIPLTPKVGLVISYQYNSCGFNDNKFTTWLSYTYPNGSIISFFPNSHSNYTLQGILAGGFGTLTINKLELLITAMAGYFIGSTPDIIFGEVNYYYKFEYSSTQSHSIGLHLSVNGEYPLGKNLMTDVSISFCYTSMSFNIPFTNTPSGGYYPPISNSAFSKGSFIFSLLNAGMGIHYDF